MSESITYLSNIGYPLMSEVFPKVFVLLGADLRNMVLNLDTLEPEGVI